MSHPVQKKSTTPLALLDPPIRLEKYYRPLWGSLVEDPYKPNDKFATRGVPDAKLPISLMPSIEDTLPLPIADYQEAINASANVEATAKLANILKGWVKADKVESQTRRGPSGRFWNMESPIDVFDDLMRIPEYNAQARKLVTDIVAKRKLDPGKSVTVFFVTGMLALDELELGVNADKDVSAGAGLVVPDPNTGAKIVEGSVEASHAKGRNVLGTVKTPTIIALSYHEANLKLKKPTGVVGKIRAFFGRKAKATGNVAKISDEVWKGLGLKPDRFRGDASFFEIEDSTSRSSGGRGPETTESKLGIEQAQAEAKESRPEQDGESGGEGGNQALLPRIYSA